MGDAGHRMVVKGAALVVTLAVAAGLLFGSGTSRAEAGGHPATERDETSDCGAAGFVFTLHGVTCENALTLLSILDGRALHQTVVFSAEGKRRGAWVCTSPTHSLVDPMRCQGGREYFVVAKAAH
jgi:hypothetical protein